MPLLARQGKPSVAQARFAVLVGQLTATLLILAFLPGNLNKLIGFVVIWVVTFRRLTLIEGAFCVGACILFSVMDIMAVRHGAFQFLHPDVAGLPIWEFFMWGFLVLHILRMLDGPAPDSKLRLVLPLVIVFALPFATITDPVLLLATSGGALALALGLFHDRWDWIYVAYAVLIGALFEYVGVWSGQWVYPGNPPGGVALWFVTMWGGIGLFVRRLVVPFLARAAQRDPAPAG